MLGMVLALVSGIIAGVGYFIQKRSVDSAKRLRNLLKSKTWMLGSLLLSLSFLVHMAALRFERLVIVEPLVNISIITIVIMEIALLNQKPNSKELLAFSLFFAGIVLLQVGNV